MVVQPRGDSLRLFRQHDHALACREIALSWAGAELSYDALLAIGMHDCGWIDDDAAARVDPDTGTPYDFIHMPLSDRARIYSRSIGDAERLSAYVGLLVSTHFASFLSEAVAPEFLAEERARRARLLEVVGTARDNVDSDYAALKALDLLSLAACLTAPGSDESSWPSWLVGTVQIAGVETELRWSDEETLVVDPFPLRRDVRVRLPFGEIESRRYTNDDELRAAIENGRRGMATVDFVRV
jgi:hypothetical protein